MMRITQRAVTLNGLQGLNSNLAALNKLQNQLTSGTTISKPSDSPTGTNTSLITRKAIAGADQYSRNITDGTTFLDATDSALQDMLSQVRRVRDLTVQALNGGSANDETRLAISTEVSGAARHQLRVAANAVAIVDRELRLRPAQERAHAERLASLDVSDDAALSDAIRSGRQASTPELWSTLAADVADRLAVANPSWFEDDR